MQAAVPLVEDERERPPLPLLQEQLPAELVVVLLLRADVEDDVGDRQQPQQLLAVGQVVAVEVGRIDEDLLLQGRPVVRHQPAVLQGRVEPVGLELSW